MEEKEYTVGEKRVRVDFNVDGDPAVDEVKKMSAHLIDLCEFEKDKDPRLCALAQTAFEEAAMWAVKLVTAK